MANRLAAETSPYLLQHAHNPVDWYPWGEEALARARSENRPVLLSVGYAACHWCHVMERESFENPDIAALMNEHYVCIKVDREERPDVDAVYMTAVQALTGRGGWPMTVFLTPDGRPFWGGTYFPPEDRHGMPGFPRILVALAQAFRDEPATIEQRASNITEHLEQTRGIAPTAGDGEDDALVPELLDHAARALTQNFDGTHGGFGGAPKFPAAMAMDFLLRYWQRSGAEPPLQMTLFTLGKMARGGIYDQLGGGFHRYSVDERWLVPHFEKMLYDNALLARVYLHAYQASGQAGFRRIVEETLDYVLREMTDVGGGFYSTQDADSEGEEGKFFIWTPAEIATVVGEEAARIFCAYYDVTPGGNFEHRNILNVPRDMADVAAGLGIEVEALRASLGESRRLLFAAREQRVHPGLDDKVLTAWNGMLLRTLVEAALVLDRADYREAAVRNARFLEATMIRDGRVLRTWKRGHSAKIAGYLEDYALLIDGLLWTHTLTFDPHWLALAASLAETMVALFWDEASGGFFDTAVDAEALVVRPRDPLDNATPSGNSVAVSVLQRLALLLDREDHAAKARRVLVSLREAMTRYPSAFGELLCALDFALSTPLEVAVVGRPPATGSAERAAPNAEGRSLNDEAGDDALNGQTTALVRTLWQPFLPNKVVAGLQPDGHEAETLSPLLTGKTLVNGLPAVYLCEHYTCQAPITAPEALQQALAAG